MSVHTKSVRARCGFCPSCRAMKSELKAILARCGPSFQGFDDPSWSQVLDEYPCTGNDLGPEAMYATRPVELGPDPIYMAYYQPG